MAQPVPEESTKVNLEKSVAIKEENSVTFKVTSVEDLVEYNNEVLNEDYVNLSPATVAVGTAYLTKSNADDAESDNETETINNIGSFFATLKDMIEANKKDNNAFFASVSTLSVILKTLEKNPVSKVILGSIGNASNLGNAIIRVRDEYATTGIISQENRDEIVYATIDTFGTLLKAISLMFPKVATAIVSFPVLGVGDMVANILKTWYDISSGNNKGFLVTLADHILKKANLTVNDIMTLLNKVKAAQDDTVITDTGMQYSYVHSNNILTLSDNSGNETNFNATENNAIVLSGSSNSVYNYGSGSSIVGGTGNDEIYNQASNVTIYGGTGADIIYNSGDNVTIKISGGNNSIYNTGSNVTIEGSEGTDTIESYGDNVTIKDTGGSKNYILVSSNTNATNHIYLNDTSGGYNTVYGGKGNDYVSIAGSSQHNLVSVSGGNDTVVVNDEYTTINVGPGNNRVTLKADSKYTKVIGGKGDDLIMMDNSSNNNEVLLYGGVNTVYGGEGRHTITTGDGDDSIVVGSGYVNAGDGKNNVSLTAGGHRSSVVSDNGDDVIQVSDVDETEDKRYHDIISAGEGNNCIYNSNVELSTISAGKGNDTIVTGGGSGYTGNYDKYENYFYNSKHISSISAGDGDNKITVNTAMSSGVILSGDGNDYVSIAGNGSSNVISIGGGNDSLIAGVKSSTINLGSGNNQVTLQSGGDSNSIIAGSGNNLVTMSSGNKNNVISLGSGSNTVYGVGGWNSVIGGSGIDLVTVGSGYINVGDGKNNISLTSGGYRSTIVTGKDDDTIQVADIDETKGKRYHDIINAGEGNNYIYNSNVELSTISADKGNDTIVTGGGSGYTGNYDKYENYFYNSKHISSISAGDGDNKITVNTAMSSGVILAGDGNDYVSIAGNGSNDYIYLGNGRNTVYSGNNNYNSITSGNGSDVIITGGNSSSINAGSGRNYVSLIGGNNSTVITGGGNDTIVLAENSTGNVIIFGGGSDLVQNYHSGDTIKSGGSVTTSTVGNDVILTSGSDKMTLKGAKGKTINIATIAATGIDTTVGDTVTPNIAGQPQETLPPETVPPEDSRLTYNSGKTAVTLSSDFTGTLNASDYVATTKTIDASKVTKNINIYGNALKNSIIGGSGADTLNGGTGNDTLTGGAGKDIFVHSYGRDIITDYVAGTDKIKIEDGEVFDYRVIGADVILYTDNGSVRVKNGKDKKITVIDEDGNETTETYKAEEIATVPPDTISAGISIKGAVLTISTVFSGSALNLENYDATVTNVNAKALNKSITITGTNTNNSLVGGAGADTISGGSGNDTLTGNAGKDIYIYASGNDVITDYKTGEDKIRLMNSSIMGASVSGSNVILNTSGGSITVKNVNGKNITVIDSSGKETSNIYPIDTMPLGLTYDVKKTLITATSKFTGNKIDLANFEATVTKINASALSKGVAIVGNTANNSLQGGKGADTISGGAGNDTLTGGAGNDVFVYEGGNDVITDYATGQNTIKIATGTIINSSLKSSDIILTTANGSITVKNGKDKKITVTDGNGNTTTEVYGRFNYNSDKSAINLASTFAGSLKSGDYASSVKTINAASVTKSSNIIGNTQNNTIIGGSAAEIISGGTGNDSIIGNSGNDKIYGDAGADTLNGGKGNDTLTGGDGADVFFYASGEGNDVIVDFTAGQAIMLHEI